MNTIDKIMIGICIFMALVAGCLLVSEMGAYDDQAARIERKLNEK
jgi:hypothetical protein